MNIPHLTRKAIVGLVFIYLAGLGWITDMIIPFTHLPNKVMLFTIALGFAETCFFIGISLLGKAYYQQLRDKFIQLFRK
jgi:hypothetical protein